MYVQTEISKNKKKKTWYDWMLTPKNNCQTAIKEEEMEVEKNL